jgi:hypothetical protein
MPLGNILVILIDGVRGFDFYGAGPWAGVGLGLILVIVLIVLILLLIGRL